MKLYLIPKYDGYQRCLPLMVYNFFDKKSAAASENKSATFANKSAAYMHVFKSAAAHTVTEINYNS